MARTPKWQFYVHRDFNIFVQWVQTVATRPDVQRRAFGFAVPLKNYLILAGDEFADARDKDAYGSLLRKKLRSNPKFFQQFARRERKLAQRAFTFQQRLQAQRQQYKKLTSPELATEFQKFLDVYVAIFATAFVRPDEFLEQRVRSFLEERYSPGEAEKILSVVGSYRQKDAAKLSYLQEPLALLKTALQRSRKQRGMMLGQHLSRFAWLKNTNLPEFVEVTRSELNERLRFLLKNAPSQQRRSLLHARRKQEQAVRSLMKKERFPRKTRDAIRDLRTFIFLRTYTTEAADRLFFCARKTLLAEIVERMHLTSELVVTCSGDEIKEFFRSGSVPCTTCS